MILQHSCSTLPALGPRPLQGFSCGAGLASETLQLYPKNSKVTGVLTTKGCLSYHCRRKSYHYPKGGQLLGSAGLLWVIPPRCHCNMRLFTWDPHVSSLGFDPTKARNTVRSAQTEVVFVQIPPVHPKHPLRLLEVG